MWIILITCFISFLRTGNAIYQTPVHNSSSSIVNNGGAKAVNTNDSNDEIEQLCLRMHNNTAFMGAQPFARLQLRTASECRHKCVEAFPKCVAVVFYYLHKRDKKHICYLFDKNSVNENVALIPAMPIRKLDMIRALEVVVDCHEFDPFPPLYVNFTESTDQVPKRKRDIGYMRPVETMGSWSLWSECSSLSGRQVRSQPCEYGRNIQRKRCGAGGLASKIGIYSGSTPSQVINIAISYPPFPYKFPGTSSEEYMRIMDQHQEQVNRACCYWQDYIQHQHQQQQQHQHQQLHQQQLQQQLQQQHQRGSTQGEQVTSRSYNINDNAYRTQIGQRGAPFGFPCPASCGSLQAGSDSQRVTGPGASQSYYPQVQYTEPGSQQPQSQQPQMQYPAQQPQYPQQYYPDPQPPTTIQHQLPYPELGPQIPQTLPSEQHYLPPYPSPQYPEPAPSYRPPVPDYRPSSYPSSQYPEPAPSYRPPVPDYRPSIYPGSQYPEPAPSYRPPVPVYRPSPSPVTPVWSVWTEWSGCQAACGIDSEQRYRLCATEGCVGEAVERRVCQNIKPCSTWSQWTSWSQCQADCGYDEKTRTRYCERGSGNCDGLDFEIASCSSVECSQWNSWNSWSECSATCGMGIRQRMRDCNGEVCSGNTMEESQCQTKECSKWAPWQEWSSCSVTCGRGIVTRERICLGDNCEGSNIEENACSQQECSQWYDWSKWSSCSVTCGYGIIKRERECYGTNCLGKGVEEMSCQGSPCSEWFEWQEWSPCSVTCGNGGVQQRFRNCMNGHCDGSDQESRSCESSQPCAQWTSWESWSSCSKSIGIGEKQRVRNCLLSSGYPGENCQGPSKMEAACLDHVACDWTKWAIWSPCSHNCGGGVSSRTRMCLRPGYDTEEVCLGQCNGSDREDNICNEHVCAAPEYVPIADEPQYQLPEEQVYEPGKSYYPPLTPSSPPVSQVHTYEGYGNYTDVKRTYPSLHPESSLELGPGPVRIPQPVTHHISQQSHRDGQYIIPGAQPSHRVDRYNIPVVQPSHRVDQHITVPQPSHRVDQHTTVPQPSHRVDQHTAAPQPSHRADQHTIVPQPSHRADQYTIPVSQQSHRTDHYTLPDSQPSRRVDQYNIPVAQPSQRGGQYTIPVAQQSHRVDQNIMPASHQSAYQGYERNACQWTDWCAWSSCSNDCTEQTRKRSRNCLINEDCNCYGPAVEQVICIVATACRVK